MEIEQLWSERTQDRLLWLHDYATLQRPPAEFARFLADGGRQQLRLLQDAWRQRPGIDPAPRLEAELLFVAQLKSLGRFDEASEELQHCLAWLPATRPERFDFLLELAETQRRGYRFAASSEALTAATALADSPRRQTALATQQAALLLTRGLPDLAVAEVGRAEQAAEACGEFEALAQALFVRLRLEHALQRPAAALSRMQAFRERCQRAGWPGPAIAPRLHQLAIRAALATILAARPAPDERSLAQRWLAEAIAAPDLPPDELALARLLRATDWLDRREFAGVAAELAAIETELALGSPAELDERRLALATLRLRHQRLRGAPPTELAAAHAALRQTWHHYVERWQEQPVSRFGEGPLYFGDCRRAFVELLATELLLAPAETAALQALQEIALASTTGSMARQLGLAPPSVAALRAALCAAGTGVLVYIAGHDSSLLLALSATSCEAMLLPQGAAGIEAGRRQFLLALAAARQGNDEAGFQRAAAALADSLLPAAAQQLLAGWQGLAIVGMESLGYLPFELLPLADGEPLGCRLACSYLPSLAVGVWLAEQRPAHPLHRPLRLRLAACAETTLAADAGQATTALPLTADDWQRYQAATASIDSELLRGTSVTSQNLFAGSPTIDFLQILAHGVRDELRADPQGILLGDGSVMFAPELEANTVPRYVVFSVCRAGGGRLRRGDDGRHLLSAAALLGGARGVVLPMLDVGYRNTLAFSHDLHTALWHDGLDLANALRHTRQTAQQRGGPERFEPFLFHLVGLGSGTDLQLPRPARSAWPMVYVAGLAILAGIWGLLGLRNWQRRRISR